MQILNNDHYTYEYCTMQKPSQRALINSVIKESGYSHYEQTVIVQADKQFLLFLERGLRRIESDYIYKGSSLEFTLAVAPSECVVECSECEVGSELLEMLLIRAKQEYYVDKNGLY